jgi:hypothetical protein
MSIAISGHVVDRRTGEGVDGLRVEAWSPDRLAEAPLAATRTADGGAFRLKVGTRSKSAPPPDDLFFRVFRKERLLASTEAGPRWPADGLGVRIEVDAAGDAAAPATVSGRLRAADGAGVEFRRVELVERAASGDTPLGGATTDARGVFRIELPIAGERPRRRSVVLRGPGPGADVLAESEPFALHADETEMDLVLGATGDSGAPDFERHRQAVARVAGGGSLAMLVDEDVERIARDAGIEPSSLERLRRVARLAEDTRLPARALYALDAVGAASDLASLSRLGREQINEAFEAAARAGAVSAAVEEDATAVLSRIRQLRAPTAPLAEVVRAAAVKVGRAPARDALAAVAAAGRPRDAGAAAARGLYDARGDRGGPAGRVRARAAAPRRRRRARDSHRRDGAGARAEEHRHARPRRGGRRARSA